MANVRMIIPKGGLGGGMVLEEVTTQKRAAFVGVLLMETSPKTGTNFLIMLLPPDK